MRGRLHMDIVACARWRAPGAPACLCAPSAGLRCGFNAAGSPEDTLSSLFWPSLTRKPPAALMRFFATRSRVSSAYLFIKTSQCSILGIFIITSGSYCTRLKWLKRRPCVGSNDGYYREMNHVFKCFNMDFWTGSSTKTITLTWNPAIMPTTNVLVFVFSS